MSHAEDVLFASLTDTDALETLTREGLNLEVIPTEGVRPVVQWCIDYFLQSGQTRAPSRDAVLAQWSDTLNDNEISLGDGTETDTIEWAIDNLKATHAHFRTQIFNKDFGKAMAEADIADRLGVLAEYSEQLSALSLDLQSRTSVTNAEHAILDRLRAYDKRVTEGVSKKGILFGIPGAFNPITKQYVPSIDDHTFGIHPGELAVLAAGPKTGKSWFCAWAALQSALSGKKTVLFTLENSTDMTWDRIICLGAGVDYEKFQHGLLEEHEYNLALAWAAKIEGLCKERLLWVIMPDSRNRTVSSLVRQARILGVEALIIDQLTFIEHPSVGRKARWEVLRDILHELKTLISTGRDPIPCLLAHQINRQGVEAAKKSGFLNMEHMAEGSEVERTADWVFGLYQSKMQRTQCQLTFQTLATRRSVPKNWNVFFDVSTGNIRVLGEVTEPHDDDDQQAA